MAIIGKIRQFSGLTIVFVGVALAAFVLGDLGSRNFSGGDTLMGEISGKDISYIEFERTVEFQQNIARMNRQQQTPLTSEDIFSIREQVWNHYVDSITFGEQYDKLGLAVSTDEISDLIYGETPHQYIASSFTNPETGQIDKEYLINFFRNLDQLPVEQKMQVSNLLAAMQADAIRTKYRTLLNKSYYAPTVFAEMRYNNANEKASIEVVQLPYSSIADSTITLTDADYEKYYNEHKESYKQEESRKIEYVIFDINPSASDISDTENRINRLYNELAALPENEIAYFVNNNTDGAFYDTTWHTQASLPASIAETMFSNAPGITVAPYREGDFFYTSRLIAESMRSDTMDAEHILIAYQGASNAPAEAPTRERAQFLADSLFTVVKRPNSMPFEILVMMYSDDPGKQQNSGKYERFVDGTMVYPFNEAVQKGKKGDIVLVETVFGFHIIKIGNKNVPQKMVRIATIAHQIMPSDATVKNVFAQASKFSIENRDIKAFHKAAEASNYNVREMDHVQPMANSMASVTQARQVVRWAYGKDNKGKEIKVNEVSDVITTGDNQFVVAALSAINPKGYASIESQKSMMQMQIMRDKKAEIILSKVKGQTGTDLSEIATKFNGVITDAPIQVTFNTMSLPNNFGRETEVIGSAFGIKEGAFYGPIKGFNGIYFIKESERTLAEPKEDYNEERNQMQNGFSSRSSLYQNILREKANIKDNRHLFY